LSVTETLLIFVGVPLAVIAVVAALTFTGGNRGARRYRPGRPFEFTPVWFLSAPEQLAHTAGTALPSGAQAPALTSSKTDTAAVVRPGATGGASDRW
jgi:hypothetical protein